MKKSSATFTPRGRLVIPINLRREHGIAVGTQVHFLEDEFGRILLQPVSDTLIDALMGCLSQGPDLLANWKAERSVRIKSDPMTLPAIPIAAGQASQNLINQPAGLPNAALENAQNPGQRCRALLHFQVLEPRSQRQSLTVPKPALLRPSCGAIASNLHRERGLERWVVSTIPRPPQPPCECSGFREA